MFRESKGDDFPETKREVSTMEYKQINDKTIKISLTFEDLKAHDIKMSDFLVNQGMVEKLFYELVSELEIEDKFASAFNEDNARPALTPNFT